uniref:Uncharacterized protein n=1 Tax=Urocitellus parryii TaxID=9999 RepID=A0A8D2HPV9_UROPR
SAYPRTCLSGHPSASSEYYPGKYGESPGGQTQNPLCSHFAAVAGQDEQIDAAELQRGLPQLGIAGGYKPFNLVTCQLAVSMVDGDRFGMMGFNEFKELWAALNGWRQHFISFDGGRSRTGDPQELQKALRTTGAEVDSPNRVQLQNNTAPVERSP